MGYRYGLFNHVPVPEDRGIRGSQHCQPGWAGVHRFHKSGSKERMGGRPTGGGPLDGNLDWPGGLAWNDNEGSD